MKLIRKKAPFKVKTVVKYWRDAKFTVYANISESQHPDSWIPLAYDTYELELADNVEIKLPELTATDSIELASDEDSFTVTFAAHHPYEELDYLVIDHNLSEFSDLPEDVEPLPSFVLYADEDNVWGTDEAKYIAEEYGLSATYDAENTSWTVTVGGKALEQIRDLASKYRDNVFEIYSIVSDVKGFQSGFMHDGSYEMTKVKITVENIKTISLDKNEVILAIYDEVYQEITLTATIEPENATNKKVTWSSSNESVATVTQLDDGLRATVKAVGEGIAVITVTTEDGAKTAECNVTVIKVNEPVINKSQGKSYSTIQDAIDDAAAGDTIEVMAGIYRGNLEIDVEGLTLKASKPGTATIAPEDQLLKVK